VWRDRPVANAHGLQPPASPDTIFGSHRVPETRALYEATYFAGLRKAGMPEE